VTKAVVLARGLGTRMRQPEAPTPAADADADAAADVAADADRASGAARLDADQAAAADRGLKAMMPVGAGGRPFLDFILSALADAGYTRACLVIGPDAAAQTIRDHYTTTAPPHRLRLTFAVQPEPRGTADALLAAEAFAAGEDVLVINGDNYYPVDALRKLRLLETAGTSEGSDAEAGHCAGTVLFEADALVRVSNIPADRLRAFALGVVSADGVLTDLIEKPDDDTWRTLTASGSQALVSMNCWRLPPAIFPICRALAPSARGELELPQAIRDAIAAGLRFRVVRSDDGVLDLSRRADVAAVADRLRNVRVDV
jgi:dTDP-glucose pyrophosphorylase